MTVIDTPTIQSSRDHLDRAALARVLEAHEDDFEAMYDMTRVAVDQHAPADFYLFKDNGSNILAVAHLDTVGPHEQRRANFCDTADGTVLYSRALDDRLGAYVLAELLPSMGLTFDLLLTVGEESGQSTAQFFEPSDHHDRQYNWIIEFDRGGTDVVLYEYEDATLVDMVEETGARVEQGIFSDISYMEHVGIKAMNWGVGYRDYHYSRAHVWLDDMFEMVDYFLSFHETWHDVHLPHTPRPTSGWGMNSRWDKPTHNHGTKDACLEERYDPHACEGAPTDTMYGRLCGYHLSWYDEDPLPSGDIVADIVDAQIVDTEVMEEGD